jgi:hypothetical protein
MCQSHRYRRSSWLDSLLHIQGMVLMLYDKRWDQKIEAEHTEGWRKLLLAAADKIEKNDWCKGVGMDSYGRVCTIGALNYAHGNFTYEDQVKARAMLCSIIDVPANTPDSSGIIRWNDNLPSNIGKKVVVETLLQAAKL